MPELPEVEAARRALQEHCAGKRITKCVVADDDKVIDGVSPSDIQSSLNGKLIVAVHRKGKNMWIQLDSPPFPSFQFGMTGAIYIKGVAVTKYKRSTVSCDADWPSKFSKVFIELDDGLEFSFTDKRRFARVRLFQDPTSVPPISELGPDALTEPMALDDFVASLSKKRLAIKAVLLDQNYISGIGNWVADEVLYQARIHPLEPAANLSRNSCESLHKAIQEVIRFAVDVDADSSCFPNDWMFHVRWGKNGKLNGKGLIINLDIKNYFCFQVLEKALEVGADSSQFPKNWIFHFREKKPGKAFVDGKKIDFVTAGGRTSAFVPELQNLSKAKVRRVNEDEENKEKLERKQKNSSLKNRRGDESNRSIGEEDTGSKRKQKKSPASTKPKKNTKIQ